MGSTDDENGRNRKEVEEKRIKKGGERGTGGEIKILDRQGRQP